MRLKWDQTISSKVESQCLYVASTQCPYENHSNMCIVIVHHLKVHQRKLCNQNTQSVMQSCNTHYHFNQSKNGYQSQVILKLHLVCSELMDWRISIHVSNAIFYIHIYSLNVLSIGSILDMYTLCQLGYIGWLNGRCFGKKDSNVCWIVCLDKN